MMAGMHEFTDPAVITEFAEVVCELARSKRPDVTHCRRDLWASLPDAALAQPPSGTDSRFAVRIPEQFDVRVNLFNGTGCG